MRRIRKEKMVLVAFHLPQKWLEEMRRLVENGVYPSMSELVRFAIMLLLEKCAYGECGNQKRQVVVEEKQEDDIPWSLLLRGR